MPNKMFPAPSLELVKEFLDYNPESGMFRWLKPASRNGYSEVGAIAGSPNGEAGYIRISLKGRRYRAHRLAWFVIYEAWPPEEIDHINGNPSDNRISNLRLATATQQSANRKLRSDNTSGYKGVCWHKRKAKWLAYIYKNGLQIELGFFDDPALAHAEYVSAAKSLFGAYAYDGVSSRAELS